jgi:hypothetical protein
MSNTWVYNASIEVDDQSNYPLILGVSLSLCVLMVITVLIRIWVRLYVRKSFGVDDVIIIAATVSEHSSQPVTLLMFWRQVCSIVYTALTIVRTLSSCIPRTILT